MDIEPFSAMLAEDKLTEHHRPGKHALETLRHDWNLNQGHGEDRQ